MVCATPGTWKSLPLTASAKASSTSALAASSNWASLLQQCVRFRPGVAVLQDPESAAQVMGLFHQLNEEGQTIVIVTHDLDLAEQALRVVRLRSGVIAEDRPTRRRLAS